MAADISTALADWSTTAGSNAPSGSTVIGGNLDDNLRQIQATVRAVWAQDSIASATTTDIGSKTAGSLTVTGTTTITGLGTVSAGIRKWLTFGGVLTLTHNASSLILPGGANITTAAGDVALMESAGSGNWRCLTYMRADGGIVGAISAADGTASAPAFRFSNDSNTGIYRVGSDSLGISAGGTLLGTIAASGVTLTTTGAGNFSLSTGAAAAPGSISITGGSATDNIGPGGSVTITGGAGYISNQAGAVTITAGQAANNGSGANVTVKGGSRGSTGAYSAGDALIRGGDGSFASNTPGNVRLMGGQGTLQIYDGSILFETRTGGYSHGVSSGTGHMTVYSSGFSAPALTSGAGTSPTIVGIDNAFKITLGTSPSTTVRVTFTNAWTNVPIVIASYQTSHIAVRCSATTTYVDLIFASSPASGGIVDVMVMGYNG